MTESFKYYVTDGDTEWETTDLEEAIRFDRNEYFFLTEFGVSCKATNIREALKKASKDYGMDVQYALCTISSGPEDGQVFIIGDSIKNIIEKLLKKKYINDDELVSNFLREANYIYWIIIPATKELVGYCKSYEPYFMYNAPKYIIRHNFADIYETDDPEKISYDINQLIQKDTNKYFIISYTGDLHQATNIREAFEKGHNHPYAVCNSFNLPHSNNIKIFSVGNSIREAIESMLEEKHKTDNELISNFLLGYGWSCWTIFPITQNLLGYYTEHKECDCEYCQIQNSIINLIK